MKRRFIYFSYSFFEFNYHFLMFRKLKKLVSLSNKDQRHKEHSKLSTLYFIQKTSSHELLLLRLTIHAQKN